MESCEDPCGDEHGGSGETLSEGAPGLRASAKVPSVRFKRRKTENCEPDARADTRGGDGGKLTDGRPTQCARNSLCPRGFRHKGACKLRPPDGSERIARGPVVPLRRIGYGESPRVPRKPDTEAREAADSRTATPPETMAAVESVARKTEAEVEVGARRQTPPPPDGPSDSLQPAGSSAGPPAAASLAGSSAGPPAAASLAPGALVWAKQPYFPWWPARVARYPAPGVIRVTWLGWGVVPNMTLLEDQVMNRP